MQLGLDVDVQKLEAERMRKGKIKAEEDLDKIKEEKIRVDQWEKKLQKARVRKVAELEKSLQQYHSRNSAIELKASLNKIEELKGKIEELESIQQNCELQLSFLKQTMNIGKRNSNALKVRLGIENTSCMKL
ncbi:hypothetical protein Goari_026787 [Gossypium aridum]|uniref:Uncharacterized protein n=1 Tax=Gossypium aridum TaxID=34290 RepID=A0A7J8YQ18_GOSAI|nr:hypothetical protein [Gossypium aridum]